MTRQDKKETLALMQESVLKSLREQLKERGPVTLNHNQAAVLLNMMEGTRG